MALTSKLMIFSRDLVLNRLEVSMNEMSLVKSLMNDFSFLLPLTIEHLQSLMCYSSIGIVTVRGVWSDNNLHSRWIVWLSSSTNPYLRNIRSITEFELWSLSETENLVGIGLVGYNSPNKRESVMSKSKLLWEEWWGYNRSQKLSLILKSPAIVRTLEMSTSVSLIL